MDTGMLEMESLTIPCVKILLAFGGYLCCPIAGSFGLLCTVMVLCCMC